jgi:hypothetical protein
MFLFRKEFDADERAEVGGSYWFSELDNVGSTAPKLLEDGLGVTEDSDTKGLPIGDLKDRCY